MLANNIFNNCNTSLELTIHSDDNWVNTKFEDGFYRYVFYERHNVNSSLYAAITEFEVFDKMKKNSEKLLQKLIHNQGLSTLSSVVNKFDSNKNSNPENLIQEMIYL